MGKIIIYPSSNIQMDKFFLLLSIGCLESYIRDLLLTDELHSFIFEPAQASLAKEAGASDFVVNFIEKNLYYEDDILDRGKELVLSVAKENLGKAYRLMELLKANKEEALNNWFIDPQK